MNGRVALVLAGGALLLGLVVFGSRGGRPSVAPPDLLYGQDVCAQCNMIISDPRFAAALVLRDAEGQQTHAFDDIGCAIEFEKQHGGVQVLVRYVADYDSKRWLDADKATYVHGGRIASPMGYGVAACEDASAAAVVAQSLGGDRLEHREQLTHLDEPASQVQTSIVAETTQNHP